MSYPLSLKQIWKSVLIVKILIILFQQCESFQAAPRRNDCGPSSSNIIFSLRKSDDFDDYCLKIENDTPLIVSMERICADCKRSVLLSPDQVLWARQLILNNQSCNDDDSDVALIPTYDYQENVFDSNAEDRENQHFQKVVMESGMNVPDEYSMSQLQSFLWVVTNAESQGVVIEEEDIIHGANAILRRQALEKWKSEQGQNILALSSDKIEFNAAAKRYRMPKELKQFMLDHIISNLFSSAVTTWEVRDATVVIYHKGDSQVPHMDPCDATILLYLSDGGETMLDCEGGDTCFPLVQLAIPTSRGSALIFFSSRFNSSLQTQMIGNTIEKLASDHIEYSTVVKETDELSLHHGGQVLKGEKIVAQIMLDLKPATNILTWKDVLCETGEKNLFNKDKIDMEHH